MAPDQMPSDEELEQMNTNDRLQVTIDLLGGRLGAFKPATVPQDEAAEIEHAARRLLERIDAYDRYHSEEEEGT